MAGESQSAVAAMLLVEELDAGPVAALERFDVGPDEDAGAVYERALALGLPPLAAALADAAAGRLATVPQVGEPTYAEKLTAADRASTRRGARASCTTACAPCRRTSARGCPSRAAYTVWRTAVRSDGPAPGVLALDGRRIAPRLRERGARVVRRPAAGRSPHARRRLAARPARRAASGDGRVSDARTLALRVITRVFDEDAYADRAFTGEAEKAKVDARERALAMHLAFGTVQRRRTLDAALEEIAKRPVRRLERGLAHVLQLGVFQILFADGIPPHAAVSESVELARRAVGARATGLTNAVLRRIAAEGPEWFAALPEEDPEEAALRHSLPDWIAETWFDAYGGGAGKGPVRGREPPAGALAAGRIRCSASRCGGRLARRRRGRWASGTRPRACCASRARSTSPARTPSRAVPLSRSLARPC